jgi:hypothetical protein
LGLGSGGAGTLGKGFRFGGDVVQRSDRICRGAPMRRFKRERAFLPPEAARLWASLLRPNKR